jgi:[ribosomal protein S18]-alanine N-acetyltransferase
MLDGVICRASTNDLRSIVELERKCFSSEVAYTPKQLKYLITCANSSCFKETLDETLRGFIIILYKRGVEVAGIETINVDPVYRGKGIGRRLLSVAEEDICLHGVRKIRLEVSMGNTTALNLYLKSGFRINDILKNYYNYEHCGTHDAYRMIKELVT